MRVFDEDSVKDIKAEERQYELWQRDQKNRILKMANTQRKQEEWNKIFPPLSPPDDSYLEGNMY